jgi:hypothetical protein
MDMFVLSTPWWVFALVGSLFGALSILVNEHYKQPGIQLLFWRGLIPTLCLTPVVLNWTPLLILWPETPVFYLAVGLNAVVFAISDTRKFDAAARYGAGVVTRLLPLEVVASFLLWSVLSPWLSPHNMALERYMANPYLAAGIFALLVAITLCTMYLKRRDPISAEAMIMLMPVVGLMAIGNMLNKTAMDHSALVGGIFLYIWLQSLLISVQAAAVSLGRGATLADLVNRRLLEAGVIVGLVIIGVNITKNTAMSLLENPAYYSAINKLSPLWVVGLYILVGRREQANVHIGLLMVVLIIGLVLLTS